jgi:DNA-binding LacI/PurR family transcriptional regulator
LPTPEQPDALLDFIRRHRLTALLAASELPAMTVDALVTAGRIRAPGDLSVVSFEQDGGKKVRFGGIAPTWIDLGLVEVGRQLARLARDCFEHRDKIPQSHVSQCAWIDGASTAVGPGPRPDGGSRLRVRGGEAGAADAR